MSNSLEHQTSGSDPVQDPGLPANGAERPGGSATTLSTKMAARAEVLRENLLRILAEHDLTFAQLARLCGMSNANAFYNLIHGRSAALSQQTLEQICNAIPGLTMDELVGRQAVFVEGEDAGSAPLRPSRSARLAKWQSRLTELSAAEHAAAAQAAMDALDRLAGSLAALRPVLDEVGQATNQVIETTKALLNS